MQDILEKAAKVKLVLFDVDGVLTDGRLFIGDDGQEYKAFNSQDGHGMVMLQEGGVRIGIITGRSSEVVRIRMQSLGITLVHQGIKHKLQAFEAILKELGIAADEVAYVGDDVVDLPVMTRVGLAITVQDANPFTKQHAHWITASDGGRGAAREVCELILRAQGKLDEMLQAYL